MKMMNLRNIINRATEFGTFRSRENFISFTLKFVFYIIPAAIIGIYTDITVKRIQKYNALGYYMIYYILLQTIIIISTLYLFLILIPNYTNEFQSTLVGSFFIVLYFGLQTNYMYMLKEYTTPFLSNAEVKPVV